MDHDTVLIVSATVISIAVLFQAAAMVGIYIAVRKIPARLDWIRADFRTRFDPITLSITEIVANTREPLRTLTTNLAAISQTLRERSVQVDAVVEELVDKSRLQIMRTDQLISNLVDKVEMTTDKVQQSVLTPLHELSAVVKGFQSGFEFLFSRSRATSGRETTPDEELFI